ncbi:hypothetical protein L3X38_010811 [Prunus dulcis]|uniref:MULE transposase domain-containing protein n=1 Tax=Prunus dulcis TaxID=3755 RepID=A0AAD4WG68_PRUDU|nr:hypothetical protein L3X38_010811 [Prunus dulcis]
MLDDDNFYDDAVDTLETSIGCGKKQKNNWEADVQVEDMNMDEKQYNSDELHSTSNFDEEGTTRRYKEFNIDIGENTYQIKSYTPKHSCSKGFHNKNITSTFLSQRYMSKIKDDPKIKKTTLQLEVHRKLGYEVSTYQCYKAKRKAQTLIEGTYAQQYEKLWEYCEEIRQTNNDSSMLMKVDPPHFQRFYVCLDACKKGFTTGCRPLIGVDACHLKGTFQGQLLVAVDIDATDNKYPIAYAVAELESKDPWCWFLQLLIEDFGPVSEYSWTFISDQ